MTSSTNQSTETPVIDPFITNLSNQVREYAGLELRDEDGSLAWNGVARQLCWDDSWDAPRWSPEAAVELCKLARKYGWWMLGHAAALAMACDLEDGDPQNQP